MSEQYTMDYMKKVSGESWVEKWYMIWAFWMQ